MPVQRLNHAVLYVRDLDTSVTFYRDALGFRTVTGIPGRAAFLQAEGSTNDHDLGLFAIGTQAGTRGPAAAPSGSTSRGRSTRSTSCAASPASCASTGRSSAPPTTAARRRSTPGTPTASSSR